MKNPPSDTVYISNLNYKRDRKGLTALFTPFGKIQSIRIIVDPSTNESKGMAFVRMGSVKEATAAVKALHGEIIDGRTIKARFAVPQDEAARAKKEDKKSTERDFKSVQLAKKERNAKKRNSNPLIFKAPAKKKKPAK